MRTSEVVMPRLGWTMETGKIVVWHKHDGEMVTAGEIILEVEGDKAVSEVEALDSGILRIPPDAPDEGAEIPVGAVLAYLVPTGESAPFEDTGRATATTTVNGVAIGAAAVAATPPRERSVSASGPAISPRAQRIATELGIDWTALTASGTSGRIDTVALTPVG